MSHRYNKEVVLVTRGRLQKAEEFNSAKICHNKNQNYGSLRPRILIASVSESGSLSAAWVNNLQAQNSIETHKSEFHAIKLLLLLWHREK